MSMTYTRFFHIARAISTTNNGKLMLQNMPAVWRAEVPKLVELGLLRYATFLHGEDAVALTDPHLYV